MCFNNQVAKQITPYINSFKTSALDNLPLGRHIKASVSHSLDGKVLIHFYNGKNPALDDEMNHSTDNITQAFQDEGIQMYSYHYTQDQEPPVFDVTKLFGINIFFGKQEAFIVADENNLNELTPNMAEQHITKIKGQPKKQLMEYSWYK